MPVIVDMPIVGKRLAHYSCQRHGEKDYAEATRHVRTVRRKHKHYDAPIDKKEDSHLPWIRALRNLVSSQGKLKKDLDESIERWKWDTAHLSSMTQMLAHPSYLRIIGLARYLPNFEVERALLRELQTEPTYWFDALVAITGEDPVREDHDFDGAVNAWLEWGRKKGII